jgi:hypothetical protein
MCLEKPSEMGILSDLPSVMLMVHSSCVPNLCRQPPPFLRRRVTGSGGLAKRMNPRRLRLGRNRHIRPVKAFDAILNAVIMESLQRTQGAKVKVTLESSGSARGHSRRVGVIRDKCSAAQIQGRVDWLRGLAGDFALVAQ